MTKLKVCKVYNSISEETETKILIERNGKEYEGALFFERDPYIEIVEPFRFAEVVVDYKSEIDEIEKVLNLYLEFCKIYNIKYYDSTLSTMQHWQYINGFSNVMYINGIAHLMD